MDVVFHCGHRSLRLSSIEVWYTYIAIKSSFGTFPGGGMGGWGWVGVWGESNIQLISAKAEAEAWA